MIRRYARRLKALVILAGLCCSCATTAHAPDGGASPVTTFGHCSSEALTHAAAGILGRVMTALSTGDYVGQLAAIATEVGAGEVGCAVDLAIAELSGMHAASPDAQVATMLSRAQAWRGSNP